jgi:hypothetical protein
MPYFPRHHRLGSQRYPPRPDWARPHLNMDRFRFAMMLASITAVLLVLSKDSVAQSTPPCSMSPPRVEPDGTVIVLASYQAYESTPFVKSITSAPTAVPSKTTSFHSAGSSSVQSGLRNGTHLHNTTVAASVGAKSSVVLSPTGVDVTDRSTSVPAMTTPTDSPTSPSSEASPVKSTLFTGAGAQNLGVCNNRGCHSAIHSLVPLALWFGWVLVI